MVQLGELMMILELHRRGLSVTAIARRTGRDPKTVRKYIERGVEAPVYGPRSVGRPSKLAPFMRFLRERVVAFPDLYKYGLDLTGGSLSWWVSDKRKVSVVTRP